MEMDTLHFHLHFPMCSHTFPYLPLIFPSIGAGFPQFFNDQAEEVRGRYEAQEVQRKVKTLEVALGGWKMDGNMAMDQYLFIPFLNIHLPAILMFTRGTRF